MAPFTKNAGVASALLGTMQLGLGAASSFAVSIFSGRSVTPMAAIMSVSAIIALLVLLIGKRNIKDKVEVDTSAAVGATH
jgi:DHA1 family bicyclomycin/chloramphenicol resistance-like MFS transporter